MVHRDLISHRADLRASVNLISGPIGEIQDFSYVQFCYCSKSVSFISLCFGFGYSTLGPTPQPSSSARWFHIWPNLSIVTSRRDSDKLPRELGSLDFPISTLYFGPTFQLSSSARQFPIWPNFTTVSLPTLQSAGPLTFAIHRTFDLGLVKMDHLARTFKQTTYVGCFPFGHSGRVRLGTRYL